MKVSLHIKETNPYFPNKMDNNNNSQKMPEIKTYCLVSNQVET